jgi:hypothetical protein
MVSSGMNNYKQVKNVTCTTDECTIGALSDLGQKNQTYGSLLHSIMGRFFVPIYGQPFFKYLTAFA